MAHMTVVANATGVPVYATVWNKATGNIKSWDFGITFKTGTFGGGMRLKVEKMKELQGNIGFACIEPGKCLHFGTQSSKDRLVSVITIDGFVVCYKYSLPNKHALIATDGLGVQLSHGSKNAEFICINEVDYKAKMDKAIEEGAVMTVKKAIADGIFEDFKKGDKAIKNLQRTLASCN